MRPEQKSQLLLGVTRSKAKMLEYSVPEEHHIKITQDPAKLLTPEKLLYVLRHAPELAAPMLACWFLMKATSSTAAPEALHTSCF